MNEVTHARYCSLICDFCDVKTDIDSPSCFVAIPFSRQWEAVLEDIEETIKEYGLNPLVAKDTPPEFLMHNICKKICSSMFGIFEITESNEGVLTEYGLMLGQGKPAILAFNTEKRRKEIHSDHAGILQVRYNHEKLKDRLRETILKVPNNMVPPNRSILSAYLDMHNLFHELVQVLDRRKFGVTEESYDISKTEDDEDTRHIRANIRLRLEKGSNLFDVKIPVDITCFKTRGKANRMGCGVEVLAVRAPKGEHPPEKIQETVDEIRALVTKMTFDLKF